MATGTETADFTVGTIRDVVDGQMRPRPNIDWATLRTQLEVGFELTEKQLKKYDDVSDGDLLKSYSASYACRAPPLHITSRTTAAASRRTCPYE